MSESDAKTKRDRLLDEAISRHARALYLELKENGIAESCVFILALKDGTAAKVCTYAVLDEDSHARPLLYATYMTVAQELGMPSPTAPDDLKHAERSPVLRTRGIGYADVAAGEPDPKLVEEPPEGRRVN